MRACAVSRWRRSRFYSNARRRSNQIHERNSRREPDTGEGCRDGHERALESVEVVGQVREDPFAVVNPEHPRRGSVVGDAPAENRTPEKDSTLVEERPQATKNARLLIHCCVAASTGPFEPQTTR